MSWWTPWKRGPKPRALSLTITDEIGLRDDMARSFNLTVGGRAPLLIKLGQDMPTIAQFASGVATYESRPFDGWIISHSHETDWLSSTPISVATWSAVLAAMPSGLQTCQHNWLRLLNIPTANLDWFDNTFWSVVASNFANLAAALAASGKQFDGIFFDTEAYGVYETWNYGDTTIPWTYSATLGAAPGRGPTETRDMVISRGRQVMDAAIAVNPSIKVWTTYGPPSSDTISFTTTGSYTWSNDTAWANELMGCFTYGIAQATFANLLSGYIDGCEQTYEVRTQARAMQARAWSKAGWTDSGLSFIVPSGEGPSYNARVQFGPGMYDRDSINGYALHTAANLQTYLTYTMRAADSYAWLYTETHEWGTSGSGKPAVTQPYIDAVIAAKQAAT